MMENKVTKEMLVEFNKTMEDQGSIVRLEEDRNVFGTIDIVIKEDAFVDHTTTSFSESLYNKIEEFFKGKGLENPRYNNTGSCFWF